MKNKSIKNRIGRMEGNLAEYKREQEMWKAKWLFRVCVFITGIGIGGFLLSIYVDYIRGFPRQVGGFQMIGFALSGIVIIFGGTMLVRIMRK